VDNLISVSQVRQKIIARNFAMFLSDLFLACRKLVLENESRKKVFEFDNTFQSVDPKLWTPTRKVQVSLHVGYGEQEKEAAKFAQLWGMLSQDPKASMFCPPEKQYKLLSDGMKKNGFANVSDYIITPDQIKPPGPDPMEEKKLEIEDKKAQAALLQAQAAMGKAQGHHEIEQMKTQIAMLLAHVKEMTAQRDADRKDMDIANKVNVSQRETHLLEIAPPAAEKAIVSPA
jgi:ribosomal protein L29